MEDASGRSKKRPAKTHDAEYREPKLLTVFLRDEHGKMDRRYKVTIDGRLMGPNALAELTADASPD